MTMKIKISTTTLQKIKNDKELLRTLNSLTLRGLSSMRAELKCALEYHQHELEKYHIVLAKINNKVVGWCLIIPSWIQPKQMKYKSFFYIAIKYRRNGIGSLLFAKAEKLTKKLTIKPMRCYAWNKISLNFFKSNKAKRIIRDINTIINEYDKIAMDI